MLSFSTFAPDSSAFLNVLNDNNATGLAGTEGSTDRLIFNQNLLATGTLGNIEFNGVTGLAQQISLGGGEFEIVPVSEPATWLGDMLVLGALGYARRRKVSGWLRLRRAA